MNAVCYDRTNGTIDIYLSDSIEGSEYAILDASEKILSHGCIFGKIQKTCLYIGELRPGKYCIKVNGVRMDFLVGNI